MNNNVIFLDIDGVLNTYTTPPQGTARLQPALDVDCFEILAKIVKFNNLSIVCSSSWRKIFSEEEFRNFLGPLESHLHEDWRTQSSRQGFRGNEVRQWVKEHAEVTNYVIIDDDRDFYQYQPLVHVDGSYGLQEKHIDQIRQLFNGQDVDLITPVGLGYIRGDLLQGRSLAIAHGCNNRGVMRSGVAKAIRETYPSAFRAYSKAHNLGDCSVISAATNTNSLQRILVFNCVTQNGYGYDGKRYVDYEALKNSLVKAASQVSSMEIWEIGIPKIGAGLGGGDWKIISRIIDEIAKLFQIKFLVYELDA